MSSSFSDNKRMIALFVLLFSVLSISPILLIQPVSAIQHIKQYPQSVVPPATLTYTSLGHLRGSIEGLIEDLSDIAGPANGQVSGKIASSGINLNNGTVEKVLFGNWSLDSEQSNGPTLLVEFNVMNYSNGVPQKQSPSENFTIGNLTVNSMQQNDGNIEIGGLVDVLQQQEKQQQQAWNDVGARLSLANQVLVLTFDETSEPGQIFAHSPIIGFITSTT
jgi:hypothetical protein